jgi:hypothetical protein
MSVLVDGAAVVAAKFRYPGLAKLKGTPTLDGPTIALLGPVGPLYPVHPVWPLGPWGPCTP